MRDEMINNELNLGDVVRGAVAGAVGGLLGAYAMNHLHALLHPEPKHPAKTSPRSKEKRTQEDPATVKAAIAVAEKVGHRLTQREKAIADPVVHYGFGASTGAFYGAAAEVLPPITMGRGMAYGAAVWLFGDEMAVPALGLSKKPTAYPVKLHADMFLKHMAFGLCLEAGRRAAKGLL
jgi:putative membrane protein